MSALHVLVAGPRCLVQDLGRPGLAHLGVGRSGAADRAGLRRANALVGNPDGAAGLEVLRHARLEVRGDVWVAVCGAEAVLDGRPQGGDVLLRVHAGQVLEVRARVRGYLAVHGGLAVPPVLGSRSTDTLAGIGPPPVQDGDVLAVGPPSGAPTVEAAPALPAPPALRLLPGPRADWAQNPRGRSWTVQPDSDRVALRLVGTPLRRLRTEELPSEGLLPGALQVPPDGQPVLFLADAPVTGGYPVVGVLTAAALDAAARLLPGDRLRFC